MAAKTDHIGFKIETTYAEALVNLANHTGLKSRDLAARMLVITALERGTGGGCNTLAKLIEEQFYELRLALADVLQEALITINRVQFEVQSIRTGTTLDEGHCEEVEQDLILLMTDRLRNG